MKRDFPIECSLDRIAPTTAARSDYADDVAVFQCDLAVFS